jgi:hypothetical protein
MDSPFTSSERQKPGFGESGFNSIESRKSFSENIKLWDTCSVTASDSIAVLKHFRTINVQWIGQ